MAIITELGLFYIISTISTVIVGVVAYYKWKLSYWSRIGLPTLDRPSTGFAVARVAIGEMVRQNYTKIKSKGYQHAGFYNGTKPVYMPVDPELIKLIMQNDFQYFMSHGNTVNEKIDPLGGHLFNLEENKWRNMRVKLTPTFTSGKMKMMFQTLVDCTVGLKKIMDQIAIDRAPADIKDILGRFTTDIIGSAAFGLECNSLENPDTEFRIYGKRVFELERWDKIRFLLRNYLPSVLYRMFQFKSTKKDVEDFFMKVVHDTVDYRERNNIYRKDFMHLLIQLKNIGEVTDDDKLTKKNKKTGETALTMNELAAQAFVFFIAGFETSSTTMTFALYELASNPDIQDKLRNEINSVLEKHGDQVTYEAVMKMTYLEKVLQETLRKYPPLPLIPRKCTQDYTIPNTSVCIKKGTFVQIPVLAIHTDPEYYPNPEIFDPDRFSEENKNARPAFTWLPFGEGPRICIGLRFGLLQSKVGLIAILKYYKVGVNNRTKSPLRLDPNSFITTAEGGVWLDVEKIQ